MWERWFLLHNNIVHLQFYHTAITTHLRQPSMTTINLQPSSPITDNPPTTISNHTIITTHQWPSIYDNRRHHLWRSQSLSITHHQQPTTIYDTSNRCPTTSHHHRQSSNHHIPQLTPLLSTSIIIFSHTLIITTKFFDNRLLVQYSSFTITTFNNYY